MAQAADMTDARQVLDDANAAVRSALTTVAASSDPEANQRLLYDVAHAASAVRVAESALQVHGGIGFTWEADVHLYLKRAQLDQVAFGDARHHRSRLAAMLRERMEAGGSVLA